MVFVVGWLTCRKTTGFNESWRMVMVRSPAGTAAFVAFEYLTQKVMQQLLFTAIGQKWKDSLTYSKVSIGIALGCSVSPNS